MIWLGAEGGGRGRGAGTTRHIVLGTDFITDIALFSMKVEPPSQFLRQTDPDWLVPRGGWTPKTFFSNAYFRRIEAGYERIELDAPDAFWQNREDPGLHHFRRAWWPPPVVIYRKRIVS